ncbi:hypothetical protein V6N11_006071 [Hibiscus sabdariffa]|uniref:Uncharacterized protein n=1 Tax=Hibiscus sabdariffa TaxID=183260 RepID=A0ABR2RPL3_9ROSI
MGELREKFRKHTEGRWKSSGNGRQQKYIQTTVFVSNLPPRLHWQVDELGLNFHPKQSDVPLQSKAKKSVEYSLGSSLDPSSVPDHATAQINESRFNCIGEDEVAKAIYLEKGSLVNEFSSEINVGTSEAVRSVLNVNSVEAFGPSTQLDRQVVRWVDVVTKNLVSQGDKVGEDLTQLHNRNLVLDPCTGQEGCEAPLQRNPADEEMAREEVGLSLSATKGNIGVERPILSDGILPNIINFDAYSGGSLSVLSVQCMLGLLRGKFGYGIIWSTLFLAG